jgi:hypothetical protein
MHRIISLCVVGALVFIPLLYGCGGDSGTGSSGKGILKIAFDNKWGGRISTSDGRDYRTHVIIPGSGHDFYMEPDDFKVIEVTPAAGDTTVMVTITRKTRPDVTTDPTREAEVGDGQTVIITKQFQVDVTDGINVPEHRWTKRSTWGRHRPVAQVSPREDRVSPGDLG